MKQSTQYSDFLGPMSQDVERVDCIIKETLKSPLDIIHNISSHVIQSGGKRLRPILTMLSSKALQSEISDSTYNLAGAIELIHTATILHDDVVDDSEKRRGSPSAKSIWGNAFSVLVGDFLFTKSFELMVKADNVKALSVLAKASSDIASGEILQLSLVGNYNITIDEYLDVIGKKTACLFAAGTEVGAIVANATDKEVHALKEYGLCLGIAFQIIDDILDYQINNKDIDKTPGDDLASGNVTLPIIYALCQVNTKDKDFIINLIGKKAALEEINKVHAILEKHKCFDWCLKQAVLYQDKAISCIDFLPNSESKELLITIAKQAVNRSI